MDSHFVTNANDLPENVLEMIFAKLDLDERVTIVPFVCKHWYALTSRPGILWRDLSDMRVDFLKNDLMLGCFLRWLVIRASAVEKLASERPWPGVILMAVHGSLKELTVRADHLNLCALSVMTKLEILNLCLEWKDIRCLRQLAHLPQLTYLDVRLEGSPLQENVELPQQFLLLNKLTYLRFGSIGLEGQSGRINLNEPRYNCWPSLQQLCLTGNLPYLPQGLTVLGVSKLTLFNIRSQSAFPGHLLRTSTTLTTLKLNQTEVPSTFWRAVSNLSQLERLLVCFSPSLALADTDQDLAGLAKLHTVALVGCDLSTFPDVLRVCGNLRLLSMLNNTLSDLQSGQFLDNLEELHLGWNCFARVPPAIEVAKKLKCFNLSRNKDLQVDSKGVEILTSLPKLCMLSLRKPAGMDGFVHWTQNSLDCLSELQMHYIKKSLAGEYISVDIFHECNWGPGWQDVESVKVEKVHDTCLVDSIILKEMFSKD